MVFEYVQYVYAVESGGTHFKFNRMFMSSPKLFLTGKMIPSVWSIVRWVSVGRPPLLLLTP